MRQRVKEAGVNSLTPVLVTLKLNLVLKDKCFSRRVLVIVPCVGASGVRRKFSQGGFIQWHMVVICIWCALFVTSYLCFKTNVLA